MKSIAEVSELSQCDGKKKYRSFEAAARIAKRMNRKKDDAISVNCYHCQHCSNFHIGHQDLKRVRAVRKARDRRINHDDHDSSL